MERKHIAILGSTGSIGTQALDVIRANPDRFAVHSLVAHRSVDLLIRQAREFKPAVVCIADEAFYNTLCLALSDLPCQICAGADAVAEIVTRSEVDIVLAAMVGYAGLHPTLEAVKAGKTIALANKETLVVAGELVCSLAKKHKVSLLPVDSEHSAVFQSLVGEDVSCVEKILLTASGGPFRTTPMEALRTVRAADALRHPNWNMGAKITIDSATMMNKGFEVIEAAWLFGVPVEKIDVLVHPQSIVHSAVQFVDGSVKAQLGMPDMRLPIQYALAWPERIPCAVSRVDFFSLSQGLTFERPDLERFPNLVLAFDAIKRGGNMPCILNAANEIVVAAFLRGDIGFFQMSEIIEAVMGKVAFVASPSYEDYVATDAEARSLAKHMIGKGLVCNS